MQLKDLDVDRIHTAFSPAKEIDDPRLFVGRSIEIHSGVKALMNRGGFIAIYGVRGVGKSSIAQQLKLIAEGNVTVPKALGMEKALPKKRFDFIVQYFRSDGFVKNVPDLIKRLLFGDENNPSLFSLTKSGERRLTEFKKTLTAEGGAGIFGAKIGAKGVQEESYLSYVSDDLIQQFRQILGTVQKDNNNKTGLLILIDEFDTIANKDGFSSIVKACSSDFIKFGVIGIATNISELIVDHSSIGRQVDLINVPLMVPDELTLILRRGEFRVQRLINFDSDADSAITSRSEGFPYFTHLLGKEAMLIAFYRNSPLVTKEDIEVLADNIAHGRLDTIFEGVYHEAVKNSPQREILLKIFSECEEDEINTGPVYALAQDMSVTNPPQLMKQLTSPDNPHIAPVLVKVRDRYFRFSDPVFKAYAKLRNWKFE